MRKKITPQQLNEWVDGLIRKTTVIGVKANQGNFVFGPLGQASELRLDYDVTALPPKQYLQPACETLLTFNKDGYTGCGDADPFVLFGVHPYDVVAIRQMDEVFTQDKCDTRYVKRRESTTIVAVDIQKESKSGFCGSMGTSSLAEGWDVLLTRIGDRYLVDAATPKGLALADGLQAFPDASGDDIKAREKVWKANKKLLKSSKLKAEPATWPELLDKGMDNPVWKEKAENCFSCGSCVLTCPTCYCFDVREDVAWSLNEGSRVRVWDGCMLPDFATVAGNHNFRKDKAARYRHRYYRKGKYVPSKIGGQIACVGCGRCVSACVAKIANPVEIFNRLMEAE